MIPDFKTYIGESFWGDVHKRSRGDEVRKEDEIPPHLKDCLLKYIEMCIESNEYCATDLTEFTMYIEDFAYHPDIKKFDVDCDELIEYVKAHWDDVVHPLIQKMIFNESFWGDVHKRSRGDEVRREDDINLFDRDRFAEYLSDLYSTTHFNFRNESDENKLCIPILEPKHNNPEGWAFNLTLKYDNPLVILLSDDFGDYYPELYKKLQETFTVKIEKRKFVFIVIYPQNGGEVTNQFYIDVLNFIIDNVENKEELIVKRN